MKQKDFPLEIMETMEGLLEKNRASFGECLAALASCFPGLVHKFQ